MSKATPIALLGSDLHLSHECPVARMCEDDWYTAMQHVLVFLEETRKSYDVPLVLAGDIFHHYREPPQLVNFAMRYFPRRVFAVPGQHDLPFHNIDHIEKSAYYTLCHTNTIINLEANKREVCKMNAARRVLVLHGFPWGAELKPRVELMGDESCMFHLAVVHHYIWEKGHTHPGVTQETHINTLSEKLRGFNAAVFGDNHSRFTRGAAYPYPVIINNGCLMRRRIDEADWHPTATLLYADGRITDVPIPIDHECIATTPVKPRTDQAVMDAAGLMEDLRDAGYVGQDFALALRMTANLDQTISPAAKKILLEVAANAGSERVPKT